MTRARGARRSWLVALIFAFLFASACGEPELSDKGKRTEGSGDPTGETGSPAPGIAPDPPSGVPPF